jgi:hypothetical protein
MTLEKTATEKLREFVSEIASSVAVFFQNYSYLSASIG